MKDAKEKLEKLIDSLNNSLNDKNVSYAIQGTEAEIVLEAQAPRRPGRPRKRDVKQETKVKSELEQNSSQQDEEEPEKKVAGKRGRRPTTIENFME